MTSDQQQITIIPGIGIIKESLVWMLNGYWRPLAKVESLKAIWVRSKLLHINRPRSQSFLFNPSHKGHKPQATSHKGQVYDL